METSAETDQCKESAARGSLEQLALDEALPALEEEHEFHGLAASSLCNALIGLGGSFLRSGRISTERLNRNVMGKVNQHPEQIFP